MLTQPSEVPIDHSLPAERNVDPDTAPEVTTSVAANSSAEERATVLIVDDSAIDRRVAGALLEKRLGLAVEFAADGREAMEKIAQRAPALVLTDVQMPDMDGLDLVEAIRGRHDDVPTVVMTSHGSEDTALQALRRGAAGYVPKRSLSRELADVVRGVLSVARSRTHQHQLFQTCWNRTEFHFILDNDDGRIPHLVSHLQQYLSFVQHCDRSESVRVGVALHEAIRNAMHHGNLELDSSLRREDSQRYYDLAEQRRREAPYAQRRVTIRAEESRDEAVYVVRDEGPGFDPVA